MRRLTYSPKVWIFIRSSNLNGRIYDVSADVVRGSLTQNLGDVSTASFVLRNRYKKYLKDPVSHRTIFRPMDLLTIWLQKTPGNPIQEFTGYLDAVPYYQGYPGDAPFSATCTLKKLAFTWFDPGLAFFQNWLIANGWIFDPTTGQATNPALNYAAQETDLTNPLGTNMNDGGFGRLLGQFMIDIGQWDSSDVLISDLPLGLSKSAASLYKEINTQSQKSLNDLSTFFSKAMGINVASLSSGSSTAGATNTAQQVLNKMQAVATSYNIPILVLAYAACALTNFNTNYSHGSDEGDQYGYGIYALRPDNLFNINTVDGQPIAKLNDVSVSTKVFCQRLVKNNGAWTQGAKNNNLTSIQEWISKALGRDLPTGVDPVSIFNVAKQFSGISTVTQPTGFGSSGGWSTPSSSSWLDTKVWAKLNGHTAQDQKAIDQYYAQTQPFTHPWLANLYFQCKSLIPDIRLTIPPQNLNFTLDMILLSGSSSDLQTLFNALKGISNIDAVSYFTPQGVQNLANGLPVQFPADRIFNGDPTTTGMVLTQSTPPLSQVAAQSLSSDFQTPAQTTGSATTDSSNKAVVSWADMASFSAESAFAANFAFPTDIIQSTLLTGEKALMNDMSCLDAVKQFAASSMRTFRTLPDGRFLGFYPDYFGAYREPYYSIENIELINFGITLNDEQLATHVYVIGDTLNFNDQVDMFEAISTHGVATITQANMLRSFIEPYSENPTSDVGALKDSYDFLNHYGARPFTVGGFPQGTPIIRNGAFEFLYAWQTFMQKWASQFATTIEVTFSPEIQAGGLIKFPDHDLQMFVESVTHSWDYSSGFTTSAVMSAPSIPKGRRHDNVFKPGFALAGGILSVGAE